MMLHRHPGFPVAFMLACFLSASAFGQMAGSRGGVEPRSQLVSGLPVLDPQVAEGYITIEGRAEVRIPPTDVRMVLAVTSEAETAQQCQQSIDATIVRLKETWSALQIEPERIVVDFIAVLPDYQWTPEQHGNVDVEVEKKVGYRMQTNVHLAAKGEAEAQAALGRALALGLTDIIAFDYWSKDLNEFKLQAREQALKAARDKAEVLLGTLFSERPPVINVQEQMTIQYPESLYHSFVNVADEAASGYAGPTRHNVPFIRAYRPRNTYYRGVSSDSDIQPRELAMKPEISVISTVRLYYKSPAAEARKDLPGGPREGESR